MSGMKDTLGDTPFEPRSAFQLARPANPSTSHAVAQAIIEKLRPLQAKVWEAFKAHPNGLTDLDLQRYFSDHRSTYRTRRAELTKLGLLKDSGRKVRQDGALRVVWVIA